MPDAVAAVLGEEHQPGDVWILNDPYRGGTHLPDITAVSPLFLGDRLAGFAAARAHHADVGGEVPGSMPARSTRLDQEGVVIPPTRIARGWEMDDRSAREPDRRACAARASARRTCARSWRPTGSPHGVWSSSPSATARTLLARRDGRRCSTTPSAARGARSRRSPTGRYRAADVLEDDGRGRAARPARALLGDRRGRCDRGRLHRHRTAESTATSTARCRSRSPPSYFVVRVLTDPDIPPCAGAYRPVTVTAPHGLAGERARPGRGGGRQRRDLEPHRRRRDARARRGRGRAGRWGRAR